jgi:hypothetical protein
VRIPPFPWGHTGMGGARTRVLVYKGASLSRFSSRNALLWRTDMPDVPNVHVRQTRLPISKCKQHRRWRRRWYPTATGVVGQLGTVAARAFLAPIHQSAPNSSFLPLSAPAFKDFRQNMMVTGPQAARGRTNAGEIA